MFHRSAESYLKEIGREPGKGPFHIRGTAYLFHQKWIEEHLPGGMKVQRDALGSFRDHPFFDTIFIASGMYDVFPLVGMGIGIATIRGEGLREFTIMRSRYQAELDLRHVRKWMVKLASPEAVAKRLPSIAQSYFDFGTASAEVASGEAKCQVRSVPEPVAEWLAWICVGFGEYALEVNGAKGLRSSYTVTPQGRHYRSYPMADLTIDFSWKV